MKKRLWLCVWQGLLFGDCNQIFCSKSCYWNQSAILVSLNTRKCYLIFWKTERRHWWNTHTTTMAKGSREDPHRVDWGHAETVTLLFVLPVLSLPLFLSQNGSPSTDTLSLYLAERSVTVWTKTGVFVFTCVTCSLLLGRLGRIPLFTRSVRTLILQRACKLN